MWALLRHHRARRGILPADITPMAFGAVGDGVSDDRYAIQLAGRYCAEAGRPLVFEADRDYAFAGRIDFPSNLTQVMRPLQTRATCAAHHSCG